MRRRPLEHGDTVAAGLRNRAFRLISPFNHKSPLGESEGYLTAIVYLAPATLGGGKTLCPHSTAACRAGCLFTAGRGRTPRVESARLRRTYEYLHDRDAFFDELVGELALMQDIADGHGMTLAIRLNGTSDIAYERELLDGQTLFDLFPRARFFDYTRYPAAHRKVPLSWHLTFSLADDPLTYALNHLRAGRSVAAVVPLEDKASAPDWFALGEATVSVVDGDLHDLRFLDPAPALVLLKPKGRLLRGGPMVRPNLIRELMRAAQAAA